MSYRICVRFGQVKYKPRFSKAWEYSLLIMANKLFEESSEANSLMIDKKLTFLVSNIDRRNIKVQCR